MAKIYENIRDAFLRKWNEQRGGKSPKKYTGSDLPLRSELFGLVQMEQHGRIMAASHELRTGHPRHSLLVRLRENEKLLWEVRNLLAEDVRKSRWIPPSGEWLLDNFHLIEEQTRTARRHLPKGYSRGLPYLDNGPTAGFPRVYDIALEAISHSDGRIYPENLNAFVEAYLSVTTLELGELWAIPIMLRLALIENLRRVAERIAAAREDRIRAGFWADQMMEMSARDPKNIILTIADMARSDPPVTSSFVAELSRRLQGQGPALGLPLDWITHRLAEAGLTIEQLVRSENQEQTVNQVSMTNSISSLRLLSSLDWRDFVEAMSAVEHTLAEDPAGVYSRMDFATRDNYRHGVERTAKYSPLTETEVARKAIDLAREGAARNGPEDPTAHVGYYLVDDGLPALKKAAEVKSPLGDILRSACAKISLPLYIGSILLFTVLTALAFFLRGVPGGTSPILSAFSFILILLGGGHAAIALVNTLATLMTRPVELPRMDYSKGIPPDKRTLVAVPTMLTNPEGIDNLLCDLEIRFLANRDDHISFALVTDLADASEEVLPEDDPLVSLAREGIESLNRKYPAPSGSFFYLFHRPRRWNPVEGVWMGYERKRGKLGELNALLRGGGGDAFSVIVGDTSVLGDVQYVLTLDTDTQLARDTARQFAAAMAHPLNRPHYDESLRRITRGYGILQPRVAVSLSLTNRSRYETLWAADAGIDPYTRTVSDVYQDLFCEGSFIGKGIYDVDAFERVLGDRFPENRILSHDLLEGCYVRAGLLSDVQLYEEYPTEYSMDVSRRHRWIRGDWQIARWILPSVPASQGKKERNTLPVLCRWKLFDNLRRSVTPAALTLLLLSGWTLFSTPWFWTFAVAGLLFFPALLSLSVNVLNVPDDVTPMRGISAAFKNASRDVLQAFFTLMVLPYEAWYSLDAVFRTLWRLTVSKKRLLEWNPASGRSLRSSQSFRGAWRSMIFAPLLSAATLLGLKLYGTDAAVAAAFPVLFLWFISPGISWWLSQPLGRPSPGLGEEQLIFLRKIARRTWMFFETFVGPEDHWLPPDNYQEHPVLLVAHRTSPTNMGLSLLSNLTASDFGFIPQGSFLDKTNRALGTMEELERFRGHFYNWYDTQTLEPLQPLYVSSVDSGNLAGHLLTLRWGLLELPVHPILDDVFFRGLEDTVRILREEADAAGEGFDTEALLSLEEEMEAAVLYTPASLRGMTESLKRLEKAARSAIPSGDSVFSESDSELQWWLAAFLNQCRSGIHEINHLCPWISALGFREIPRELDLLDKVPSLSDLADLEEELADYFAAFPPDAPEEEADWAREVQALVAEGSERAQRRISLCAELAEKCTLLADGMDFDFLYDKARNLLAIGYNVRDSRLDPSYYDLLASEARFASFVAISRGKIPQTNWFALGRQLAVMDGSPTLLSWSGSMFEYLMPLLVMPSYENTLLDESYRGAVNRQREYGAKRKIPWGISESGYNAIDAHLNYQYRAFGVPGLGIKRGLADDLVIAPYATALALMVSPRDAYLNLERLASEGILTRYGYYEAVDYTPSRLPRGQSRAVIRSFMAHHQGMAFLSLSSLLLSRPMQRRFEADPAFQATMLLLQERIPKTTAFYPQGTELAETRMIFGAPKMPIRVFSTPDTPIPEVQLLSNGRYHVMVTNAGGGYSRWNDMAVTRWREDRTRDSWGTFCYLRDVSTREYWSVGFQPTGERTGGYEAIFSEGRAEFRSRENDYDLHMEIAVSPEDDVELRRLRITNRAKKRRSLDVTSYGEVVMAEAIQDALHPAFSNLFVQTELLPGDGAILCTRRPRSPEDSSPLVVHMMDVHGARASAPSFETDRMKFIGRGRTVASPAAVAGGSSGYMKRLSNSSGSVLDPVVSIRYRVTLNPEQSATVHILTGVSQKRESALELVKKYRDQLLADRVFDLAWTHGQVMLRQVNITEAEAQLYSRLASSVIYGNPSLRAESNVLLKNTRGQSGLWGYALSGDLPIVLLRIEDSANINLVRQLVSAHAYWRLKGMAVDLVIWNEDFGGYRQVLHDQILDLVSPNIKVNVTDPLGGIFLRPADQIGEEDRILIQSVARVVLFDSRGTLEEQLASRKTRELPVPALVPTRKALPGPAAVTPLPRQDLSFFNGLGGFTPDGREYIITTTAGQRTPAPWANVIANPFFGTVVSESGMGTTWTENAHELRITPWANDPVSDTKGEVLYLRDEDRGHFWSPTPLPCGGATPYVTRHGLGYSVYEHTERGIRSELWVYVAMDAPIKFFVLRVKNLTERPRKISATGYVEWVLGDRREKWAPDVFTEISRTTGAILARNSYNEGFGSRTAFFHVDGINRTLTGDRTEFLGRNGSVEAPAAMQRTGLTGRVGAGLDPCGALQVEFPLAAGEEQEVVFRLGAGRDTEEAEALLTRFTDTLSARTALDGVWKFWTETANAVAVRTPDEAFNILANGWLIYQTLSCRIWGRSAVYQSGGAYGFRDQLQDVMSIVHTRPSIMRDHIVLYSSRQFHEGDVQHWWHPPSGQGVRTKCSDDYLWLPYAAARYIASTEDWSVLDEKTPFLRGRPLLEDEESYYDQPVTTEDTATVYEHCVKAVKHGLRFGERGLPLMGSGDWNDGMNLVGIKGKGESVWLGFFLYDVLTRFSEVARGYGDAPFAEECLREAARLRRNIERSGWDGEWYRRAYFDDGTPLGSASNEECRIDSIAQSWSVLSGAGDVQRSRTAMESLKEHLVRREAGLIQLLDPPFDKSSLNPGYIKGYVPGVRENGGQYTHSAIWATMAFAALGDCETTWELFSLINPVNHGRTPGEVSVYKAEPYVMAADVYAVPPHTGRGGWTWYTGSSGWMYRLLVESILGLELRGKTLHLSPCVPAEWKSFQFDYRYGEGVYRVEVLRTDGVELQMKVDGRELPMEEGIPLAEDGQEHWVQVRLP